MAAQEKLTGYHGVEEALKSSRQGTLYISKKGPKIEALIKLAKSQGKGFKRISPKEMDRMSRGHRGFVYLGEQEQRSEAPQMDLASHIKRLAQKPNPLILLLDSITDPHNLGAILRSSDCFKADLVVLPKRRSASENDTVARTSAGAVEWVPVVTMSNLNRAIEELREAGYWIYGAQMEGTMAHELDMKGKVALVMGSEGHGLSRLVSEGCDGYVSIPIKGHVDSLNVSVATGILLYEIRRQQGGVQ